MALASTARFAVAALVLTGGVLVAQPALAVCGDSQCNFGETCSTCPEDCCPQPTAPCGDGICEDGLETCSSCAFDCCAPGTCGDGTLDGGEECDDGNADAGDGCDGSCALEVKLMCTAGPNFQHAVWLRAGDATGAPEVTFWDNLGRSADFGAAAETTQPELVADVINGHPVLRFEPQDGLEEPDQFGGFTSHAIIAVIRANGAAAAEGHLVAPRNVGNHRLTVNLGPDVAYHTADTGPGVVNADQPHILTALVDVIPFALDVSVNAELMVDGFSSGSGAEILANYVWSLDTGMEIGNDNSNLAGFHGDIAELIVFKRGLAPEGLAQIHTYLAVKYGIALPVAAYQDAAGTALYGHDEYPLFVAGVGRNDCSGLLQEESVSATDATLKVDASGASLADGQYLLWGSNAATTSTFDMVSELGCAGQRVSRVYRFGNKGPGGAVGPVRVEFDLNAFGLDIATLNAVRLLVDDDLDFTTDATSYLGAEVSPGVFEFTGVVPTDDAYFTVFACPESTCGNGLREGDEACDDNNLDTGDGCDDSCQREVTLLCEPGAGQHSFWVRTQGLAAGNAVGWNDVGGPNNLSVAPNQSAPPVSLGVGNGNNAIILSGTAGLSNPTFDGTFQSHTILMAALQNSAASGRVLLGSNGDPPETAMSLDGDALSYGGDVGTMTSNRPFVVTARTDVAGDDVSTELFFNGEGTGGSTSTVPNYMWSADGGLNLGNNDAGTASVEGAIGEVVMFERALSAQEQAIVESYLAIKFGLNLPADGYVGSDGTPLYGHAGHANAIAGVARNDCQQLDQQQGTSADEGGLLTVTADSLADGQYALFGHDGAAAAAIPAGVFGQCNESRLHRTYRVGTGGAGDVPVRLVFKTDVLGGAFLDGTVRMLVDADGDFSSGYSVIAPAGAGAGTHFFDVAVDHGDHITIVAYHESPVASDFSATVSASGWVFIPLTGQYTVVDGAEPSPEFGVSGSGVYFVDQPTDGIIYQANTSTGSDTLQYTVCSVNNCCDTGSVDLTLDINTAPVASDDSYLVNQDTPQLLPVLGNDNDPEGNPMTPTVTVQPSSGTATVQPSGQILYAPDPGFFGADSFQYEVCDDSGACSLLPATVTITVNGAPFAGTDGAVVPNGSTVIITVSGNDIDPEGEALTWALASAPGVGGAVHLGGAQFQYTAPVGASGNTSFTYSVCDPHGACTSGTVNVTINNETNLAPIAVEDQVSTPQAQGVTVNVLANDTDPNAGDVLSINQLTAGPAVGIATFDPVFGTVSYTPPAGFTGIVTITYEVCDDKVPALCDTADLEVTVDGPTCGDGTCNGTEICTTCPGDCGTCVCGNGAIEADEQCDDGNTTPYDGCDENCQKYDICGAGVDPGDAFWVRADWIPGADGLITFWDAIGSDYDLTNINRPPRFDTSTPPTYFNGHPALNAHPISRDGMRNGDFDPSGGHNTFLMSRRWINSGGVPLMDGGSPNSNYALYNFGNSLRWRYSGSSQYSLEPTTNNRPYIHSYATVDNGSNMTGTFYVDGVTQNSMTRSGDGSWGDRGITIADWYNAANSPVGRFYGHVAEVIVCPTELDTTQRNGIETYLSVKYGVPIPGDNYVGVDGADLYDGPSGYDTFVVGIGRQDRQGLNQTETSSYIVDWLDISTGSMSSDQYALVGGDVASNAWLAGSPVAGYDRMSETTYYYNSRGTGGPVANVTLTFIVPFSLSGYSAGQFFLVHDNISNLGSPTAIVATGITPSTGAVTFANVTIPDGHFFRIGAVFPPNCSDGIENGLESDVDCGGNCGPCPAGDDCNSGDDCDSLVCSFSTCQAPTCSDGVRNGAEEDIDCGPGCVACGCVTYMGNEANTCNGLDEDCDGETDENYDDGLACTASFCSNGQANNIPNNILCNDFNGCTADICDVGIGGCININDNSGTPDATMDDGNPCTDLRCSNGNTVNVVDNTNVPDDGLFCTTQTCSGGNVQTSVLPGYCLYQGECIAHGQASTQAPCGVCDTSRSQTDVQTDIIDESFETNSGWSFAMQNGGGLGVNWQRTTTGSSDGSWSLYFGRPGFCQWELLYGWLPWYVCYDPTYDVGQHVQGTATGPSITVSNTNVDLTFDLYTELEWSTFYDVVYLEVNDGGGWDTVWSYGFTTFGWTEQVVSLSAYAGQTVQIRFRFDSRDSWSNDWAGVWIDNLEMKAACCFTSSDCDDGDSCTVDFCSEEQGCRHINTCVAGCDAKKNILLVLDYSGSMQWGDGTGQSKWESAVDGINAAMTQFEPLMNTGLLLFPSQTDAFCGVNAVPNSGSWMWPASVAPPVARAPEFWFGTSRATLIGHLNSIWPPGGTPMAAGVRRAADVYNSGHPTINTNSANYVLLISDGAESCGTGDPAAEVLNLYNQGIETFVIGFGSGVDSAVLEAAANNGGHAKSIGEAYYSASNEGEMTDAMVEILLEITAEQCDGIDNDCNGIVDDGVPEQTCFVTCNGVSYPGVSLCTNGAYSACQLPNIVETCDGVDNNCNGQTDEGFALGASCTVGVGACQNTGTMVCDGTGNGTTCSAIPGVPVTETCDTIDNDCDGQIDETFPLGQACDGDDDDLCATGTWTCAADGTAECVNETESYTETCDGVDNNCDGVPDDGFGVGTPCDGPDSDFCNEGVIQCEPATLGVICSDTSGDSIEICNGVDDDCDGKLDEGFDVGFPCDGPDADFCMRGEKVCSADGSTTVCADDSPNSDEVCNGFDDDCDGNTDEQDAGGCVVYYADNDGDGHGAGPGLCLCVPDGAFTSTLDDDCDDTRNDVYPGSVEVCDGVDQDCDGTTDENPQTDTLPWIIDCYTGPDGTEDVGICRGGTTQCNGASGFDPTCVGEVTPQVEACDDVDNDCDGTTDEENANGCTVYYRDVDNDTYGTGPSRCLCDPEGEWDNLNDLDCNDDNAMINPDATEVCDGIDNECDGFIDEDPGNPAEKMTQSCYTGPPLTLGVGTCHSGTETCDSSIGDWGPCEDETVPTLTESCDGEDTDCDGIGDADEPGGGDPDTEHACSYDPACAGLSCYCFNNTQTGMWACIAD